MHLQEKRALTYYIVSITIVTLNTVDSYYSWILYLQMPTQLKFICNPTNNTPVLSKEVNLTHGHPEQFPSFLQPGIFVRLCLVSWR